jgi:hypothetical protein
MGRATARVSSHAQADAAVSGCTEQTLTWSRTAARCQLLSHVADVTRPDRVGPLIEWITSPAWSTDMARMAEFVGGPHTPDATPGEQLNALEQLLVRSRDAAPQGSVIDAANYQDTGRPNRQ